MKEWINGKKTYILAITGMIGTVVAWASGQIDLATMIRDIVVCGLAVFIRNGIG